MTEPWPCETHSFGSLQQPPPGGYHLLPRGRGRGIPGVCHSWQLVAARKSQLANLSVSGHRPQLYATAHQQRSPPSASCRHVTFPLNFQLVWPPRKSMPCLAHSLVCVIVHGFGSPLVRLPLLRTVGDWKELRRRKATIQSPRPPGRH